MELGKCIECKKPCNTACEKCLELHCSVECQRKAWPKHYYTCSKKTGHSPTLTSALENPTETRIPSIAQLPASGGMVTLTSITKINAVFVRPVGIKGKTDVYKLMDKDAATLKKFEKSPTAKQLVVAKFQQEYRHALVVNADDVKCIKLFYFDVGDFATEHISNLFVAPDGSEKFSNFAIPVLLKDVPDWHLTDLIRKFLYSHFGKTDLIIKYDSKQQTTVHRVELINAATKESFNKTLSKLCESKGPQEETLSSENYLQWKYLLEQMKDKLIVMDNSKLSTGIVSCTTAKYALKIWKFNKELQLYGNSLKAQPFVPRLNELCIARYDTDGRWYRARCMDVVGDGFPMITYIDFGNTSMVSYEDLRPYLKQFKLDVLTYDFKIAGLPEGLLNPKIKRALEQILEPDSTVVCTRIEAQQNKQMQTVTLPEVLKTLKEAGLLLEVVRELKSTAKTTEKE